jgi:hypothetical protein
MNEEEIFAVMAKKIIKSMAISLLKSRSLSKNFAEVENSKEIEQNVDEIVEDIMKKFLIELRRKSNVMGELSGSDFNKTLTDVITAYFGDSSENKNKAT